MNEVAGGTIVVAIDPGKTTGWATYDTEDGTFASGQVEGRFDFYAWLRLGMSFGRPIEVVAESFTITARTVATDRDMNALYIIGYVEGLAEQVGWPFALQQPGAAKGFASNEKLAILGWRNPQPGGHADDAARHLLTYLAQAHRDLVLPLLVLISKELR